jgi:hypothetical protein
VGIQLDKNDRYADQYYFILGLPDASRMWTDYSMAFLSQWKLGKVLFNGKFQYIRSSNYWWQKNKRMANIHAELGLQYDF